MPFTSYASVADVCQRHSIQLERSAFLSPAPFALSEHFRSEWAFTLAIVPYDISEAAARETLIYPLLREVWKPFSNSLMLWNNAPLDYDNDLNGVPDFMVSLRSPLGPSIPNQPYMLIVEAKKDNFAQGWGQCLAAMLAAQKLDATSGRTYYGATTNGRGWEFGQLQGNTFAQDPRVFGIENLDGVTSALHFLLIQCRDQAAPQAVPA